MTGRLLGIGLLLMSIGTLCAQPVQYPRSLVSFIEYKIDSTHSLDIDNVVNGQLSFTSNNILSNDHPTWLKVRVPADVPFGNYYLKTKVSELHQLYISRPDGIFFQENSVDIPPARRSVPMTYLFLKVSIQPGDSVLYLKVSPVRGAPRAMELFLHRDADVEAELVSYSRLSFFITGAMLFILLFSLTLFFFLSDWIYMSFCIYVLCSYLMSNSIFLGYWLGDAIPILFANFYANQVYFILYPLSLMLFFTAFLQIKQWSPAWLKVFYGVMSLSVICFVTIPFDRSPNSDFILIYNSITIVLVVTCSVYAFFWRKVKPALYFLLAFLVPVVVAVLIVLNYVGWISIPNGLGVMAGFSFLVQSVILSFGLIMRYRQLTEDFLKVNFTKLQKEREAEVFKTKNLELVTQNETIEKQKILIEGQAKRLEEMNETKDKLLSVLSHDLRGPVGNLNAILSMLSDRMMNQQEFYNLAEKLKFDVKGAQGLIEDVLLWVKSQQSGIVVKPVSFNVRTMASEIVSLMSSAAEAKQIQIDIACPAVQTMTADYDHVHIILRNLVGNAIKFSPFKGHVKIEVVSESGMVTVKVIDQGAGLTKEEASKIMGGGKVDSTPGTMGEKGTGIGLMLCKEFISLNEGHFFIDVDSGKGTTVGFSLPV